MSLQMLSTQWVIYVNIYKHYLFTHRSGGSWSCGHLETCIINILDDLTLWTVYLECKGGLSMLLACVCAVINQQGYCVLYAL